MGEIMEDETDGEDMRRQLVSTRAGRQAVGSVVLHEHDTNPGLTEEIVEIAHESMYAVGLTATVSNPAIAQNASPNTSFAWEAMGPTKSFSDKEIATEMKRRLDEKYGGTWHVIVGAHFGGNITSDAETLVNFQIDKCHFLVFRSGPPDRPNILEGSGEISGF